VAIHSLGLLENSEALKSGKISLSKYVNKICDRIDNLEPIYHSLLPESNRRSRLLKETKELENKYPDTNNRPSLFGVLLGVKDIFSVEGFPTKAGSKLPSKLFEKEEANSVKLLKEAGALILGKTVTTEFAYFSPGPTRNPYNPAYTPGGSSSGSAAAVALGLCPLALGTQTIGSVIRPASYCGILGFKPSFDRINTEGLVYFSKSYDHVGLFTQDLEGMELASSILCKGWESNKKRPGDMPVIGLPKGPYLNQVNKEILDIFEDQINKFVRAGFTVKSANIFDNIKKINARHRRLGAAEMARVHKEWFNEYYELYSKKTREIFEKGILISDQEINNLQQKGPELRSYLSNFMIEKGIELWISPSTIDIAPKGLESTGSPIMNLPWTHAGMPTLNIPIRKLHKGLPLGLQITANFWKDEMLLQWANNLNNILIES